MDLQRDDTSRDNVEEPAALRYTIKEDMAR